MQKQKICKSYCGVTCVNGNCPNALSNFDAERDDDAYAWAHLDKPVKCNECSYNNGCRDCALFETEHCSHEIDNKETKIMISDLDLTKVGCPRCGKKYFKETGFAGAGSFYDVLSGMLMSDCVYRQPAEKIYKDGVLQNPEAFTPEPTKKYFKCLDCGCNFYVKTSYEFAGGDIAYVPTYETFDADKEKEECEAAWKKQREERKKEEEIKKAEEEKQKAENLEKYKAEHPGEFLVATPGATTATINIGNQAISVLKTDLEVAIEELKERVKKLEERL